MAGKKSPLNLIAGILLVIGGLNWGVVGISGFLGSQTDLVWLLFGSWLPQLAWVVYILVGVSAIIHLMCCVKGCNCEAKNPTTSV